MSKNFNFYHLEWQWIAVHPVWLWSLHYNSHRHPSYSVLPWYWQTMVSWLHASVSKMISHYSPVNTRILNFRKNFITLSENLIFIFYLYNYMHSLKNKPKKFKNLKFAVLKRRLKHFPLIVWTLGGHFKDKVCGIAQELFFCHRGVHGLQHGHQSVQRVAWNSSLTAPEILY